MEGLTARQAEALRLILTFVDVNGYPPSLRELARLMGVTSTNGVNQHLRALKRKGFIELAPRVARGIRVVERESSQESK